MTTHLLNVTIDLYGNGKQLNVCLLGYSLELASAFGTSHSTSTFRHNALLLLRVPSCAEEQEAEAWTLKGVSEVGLPPKKEMVYEADLDDMTAYVLSFLESFHELMNSSSDVAVVVDAFAPLPEHYFARVRGDTTVFTPPSPPTCTPQLPYAQLLQALDTCSCNSSTHSFARAGRVLSWTHGQPSFTCPYMSSST